MKVTVIGGGSTYTPELVSGFLMRTARGRVATSTAYRHFGMRVPKSPDGASVDMFEGEGSL